MRTIGYRRPRNSPRGDFETMCDICGVAYLRSRLRRRDDGMLYCRDCDGGLTRVGIANAVKSQVSGRRWTTGVTDGGNFDHQADPPPDGHHALPVSGPSAGTPGDGIKQ